MINTKKRFKFVIHKNIFILGLLRHTFIYNHNQIIICLSSSKIVEVTDNKYNPNTYTAESVKKYETCCLNKIMPKTKTKMNMHEAIIYNIIIKRHVIGKNRIILNHKKRINYT